MKTGSKNQSNVNRSEELRRRRTSQSQQRVSTAANRAANPVRTRPVTVRGNAFGTPIHRQAAKNPSRRAYYVTMDRATGSEMRLPTIPIVNPGWRLASAMIAILMMVGIYSLWSSPFFRIGGIEAFGLKRLSVKDINETVKLENLSVIEVDGASVTGQITKAFPELENVSVSVSLPNVIAVHARERQPVIAWHKGDQVKWIDSQGVIFPARGDVGALVALQSDDDLPQAPLPVSPATIATQAAASSDETTTSDQKASASPATSGKVDPGLLLATQELSKKLPADTPLIYSNKDGMGWMDAQGWRVYIGKDLDNFEAKYEMYQKLVRYIDDNGLKPVMVSVENLNAPFYRLEQ